MLAQTSGQVDKKSELSEKEEEEEFRQQRREPATLKEDVENEVTPFDEVNNTISDDELHRNHDTPVNTGLPLESGPSDLETQPPENSEAAEEETNLVLPYPNTLAGSVPLPLSSSSDIYPDRLPLVEDSVTSEGMD